MSYANSVQKKNITFDLESGLTMYGVNYPTWVVAVVAALAVFLLYSLSQVNWDVRRLPQQVSNTARDVYDSTTSSISDLTRTVTGKGNEVTLSTMS